MPPHMLLQHGLSGIVVASKEFPGNAETMLKSNTYSTTKNHNNY